jgi:cell shape-determining protein MreC
MRLKHEQELKSLNDRLAAQEQAKQNDMAQMKKYQVMVTEFKEQLKEFRESLSLGSKSVRNTSSNSSSNSKHHVRKEIREMEEVPFTER